MSVCLLGARRAAGGGEVAALPEARRCDLYLVQCSITNEYMHMYAYIYIYI